MSELLINVGRNWQMIAECAGLFALSCLLMWWIRRHDPAEDEPVPPLSEPTRRWMYGDGSYYEAGQLNLLADVNWDGKTGE